MAGMSDMFRVSIAFNDEPWASSPTFTEFTVISAAGRKGRGLVDARIDAGRERGAGGKFRPRTATLTFNNNDGDYDSDNSANSVFGTTLKRNRLLIVQMSREFSTYSSFRLFTGFIDDIVPTGNATFSTATILARDALGLLAEYDVDDLERPEEYAGQRIQAILVDIGIPSAWYSIKNGTVMMPAETVSGNALSILQEAARAEYGYLYCSNDGVIRFQERHGPLEITDWSTRQHSFNASGSSGASKIRRGDVTRSLGLRDVTRVASSKDGGDVTYVWDETPVNNPPITPGDGPYGLKCLFDNDVENAAEAWYKGWAYEGERITEIPVLVYPGNTNALTGITNGGYEPMTRVEVQLTPAGFTTDFNFEARVEQASHHVTPDEWTATVGLSPYQTEWVDDGETVFYEYGTALDAFKVGAL